jgi:hypothetical protein
MRRRDIAENLDARGRVGVADDDRAVEADEAAADLGEDQVADDLANDPGTRADAPSSSIRLSASRCRADEDLRFRIGSPTTVEPALASEAPLMSTELKELRLFMRLLNEGRESEPAPYRAVRAANTLPPTAG